LPGTNALAYFTASSVTTEKSLKRRRQADDGVYHSISGPCQTFDDDKVPKRFFFAADAGNE
jgi:hypothetical protein